jgi:hypothetical protein
MHESAQGTTVAFAERESDLARMTILRMPDGTLAARRRRPDDVIVPSYQTGAYNDMWEHVRSGGRYIRHDDVLDLETREPCYDYSSCTDGRLWLRSRIQWHEEVDGKPRFRRMRTSLDE